MTTIARRYHPSTTEHIMNAQKSFFTQVRGLRQKFSREAESNRRPEDLWSPALPTELSRAGLQGIIILHGTIKNRESEKRIIL